MQPCAPAFFSVLQNVTRENPRDLAVLFEFYPYDVTPGPDGYDPADAVQRFAKIELTWLGYAYRRIVLSAGTVSKAKGEQTNRCTVRLSNADENRYAATWVTQNEVEGMRLVVRLISRSASTTLAASNQRFSGRCDKPEGFDVIQGSISATEEIGDDNVEWPPRTYTADDPEGRVLADPLHEGFPFITLSGTFTFLRSSPDKSFSRRDSRRYWGTLPYSSYDNTKLGDPIPIIGGRSQMRVERGIFMDEGRITRCLDWYCQGPIAGFLNFRHDLHPDSLPYFSGAENVTYHLGEAGGTGTQTHDPLWPNHPYFSYTAYVGFRFRYIGSGSFTNVDPGAPTVATILGMVVDLPDASGVFNQTGWTDNGAYLTRHLITNFRFFNLDPAFVEDAACFATGRDNDRAVVDESGGETIFLPDPELSDPSDPLPIPRVPSTGLINTPRARYHLGLDTEDPAGVGVTDDFETFDPVSPPSLLVPVKRLRKNFTTNFILKERVKAREFLYKTVLGSYRGYLVWNWRGRIEPRSERPADFTHMRAASLTGATSIAVEDVTPWTASGGLWGRLLTGVDKTTSEVRDVLSAAYTSDANSITLAASASIPVTATPSGATLTGGNAVAPAIGTVSLGGVAQAGAQVTVTIQGIQVAYTFDYADTLETAAYMLAAHVNAHTQLRRFVSASASGVFVTITSKWGTLSLSSALANPHDGPVANPTAAPSVSASGSGNSLPAGAYRVAYANRNANGSTYASPYAVVTIAAGQQIDIAGLPLPAGVTSRDWFMSRAAGDSELALHSNRDGSGFAITSLPSSTAAFPPEYNTTGEEVSRRALSFASNNQTAAVLAQAGLTRGNAFDGSYKWPGGRDQTRFTEIIGNYVSAKDDFVASKVIVSDPVLKARLGKRSPLALDLTAVDNYHQARRLTYFHFARLVDRHWFNSLGSNGLALLLEEGDVICASDDSGDHVNVSTQVEAFSINLDDFTVSISKARLYSTAMFRELVPKTQPIIPSVLRWTATLDTVFQVLDIASWRADEVERVLMRIAARPADGLGDWQGYTVWLDDGNGYQQVGANDVIATLGELITDLPAASPYVFDRTNTVRVRVDGKETLTTRTEAEVLRGANLARANGALFRFTTATVVSSTDSTTTYDLSGLMVGVFGTELKTASAGDEFTLLDGSETVIELDAKYIGRTLSVKCLTVNRNLADTTAQTVTFTGASVRRAPPINFTSRKDSTDDTLGEFGLRTLEMGPLREGRTADESRRLARLVFFTDGTYATPLNREPLTIRPGDELPLALMDDSVTGSGTFTKNSIAFPATSSPKSAVSLQVMPRSAYGNKLSAELETTWEVSGGFEAGGHAYFALIDGLTDWRSQIIVRFAVELRAGPTGTADVRLYEGTTEVMLLTGLPAKERWTLVVETGVVKFYRAGKADAPVYVSATAPVFPMRAYLRTQKGNAGGGVRRGNAAVNDAIMTSAPEMKFFYSSQQRAEDYGSTSATAYGLLFEVDEVFGKGHELPVEF